MQLGAKLDLQYVGDSRHLPRYRRLLPGWNHKPDVNLKKKPVWANACECDIFRMGHRRRQDARCQYGEVGCADCPLHICELGTQGFEDVRPETQASSV